MTQDVYVGSDWKGQNGVRKGGRGETNLLLITKPGVILGRIRGEPPPNVAETGCGSPSSSTK